MDKFCPFFKQSCFEDCALKTENGDCAIYVVAANIEKLGDCVRQGSHGNYKEFYINGME